MTKCTCINQDNTNTTMLLQNTFERIHEYTENVGLHDVPKLDVEPLQDKQMTDRDVPFYDAANHLSVNFKDSYQKWAISGEFTFDSTLLFTLEKSYNIFSDAKSKATFNWVIQFMVTWLLTNSLKAAEDLFPYPSLRSELYYIKEEFIHMKKQNDLLYDIDGYTIHIRRPEDYGILRETWIYNNYLLEGRCEPKQNDIVIDAGAYIGDSSIWFAQKTSPDGKIYAFEIEEPSIEYLLDNVKRNSLDNNIKVVDKGLWSQNTSLKAVENYTATAYSQENGDFIFEAITIDTFVKENCLDRVDYIKMDIEGAEIDALKGAENTIKTFKPKLAIALYHKSTDIIEIPDLIKTLVPEYRIYLSHKLDVPVATILFALLENN